MPLGIVWDRTVMKMTASLPEAKRLFWISKMYNLPINDSRIASMTQEQMELLHYMMIIDNPKLEEQGIIYDDEYDEAQEQAEQQDKDYTDSKEEDWQDI